MKSSFIINFLVQSILLLSILKMAMVKYSEIFNRCMTVFIFMAKDV